MDVSDNLTWQSFLLVTIVCTHDNFTRMLSKDSIAFSEILLLTVKFYIVQNCSLHTLSRPAGLSCGSGRTMFIRINSSRKGRHLELYGSARVCVCNPTSPVFCTTAIYFLGFQSIFIT